MSVQISQKFGKLTVIEQIGKDARGNKLWNCECECGNYKLVPTYCLKRGSVKSCGCLRLDASQRNRIHGLNKTYIRLTLHNIKQRCYNVNHNAYKYYGGRGITVHERYMDKENGLLNFLEDVGERPSPEYSIDRIDNDKNYEPGNLKWSTDTEQQRNTRRNRLITYKGETKTISEMAEKYNISKSAIRNRLEMGWSVEKAIETPLREKRGRRYVTYKGETLNASQMAKKYNIPYYTMLTRIDRGWNVEDAIETPV